MPSLREIPDKSLPSNLQVLTISASQLLTVGSHAFEQIGKTLQNLQLANVRFSKIPDAFSALTNVTYFNIRDANISDWNENATKHLGPALRNFQSMNVGMKLFPGWLKYCTALRNIQISNDPVSYFPDDSFDGFRDSLTFMTISNGNMTQTPKAFTSLRQIQDLHLADNNITEVKFVPQVSNIKSLVLAQNKIKSSPNLTQNLLPLAKSLDFLDLSSNNLTQFPDFSAMSALTILSLNENQISDAVKPSLPPSLSALNMINNRLTNIPPFTSVANLNTLDLSSNFIPQINGQDIPATVQMLVLTMNKITSLQENSFPENSSLTFLDLSMNVLRNISNQAFNNVEKLQYLSLQSVNITRLPMALASLTNMRTLILADNDNLVCTCHEAGLLPWFRSLPNMIIDGKCGNMTITYFFENVAPNCHTLF